MGNSRGACRRRQMGGEEAGRIAADFTLSTSVVK